jgi:AcrR family transcriptional regulator
MLKPSAKQRALRERDQDILRVGRELVLVHGYHGMTMNQISQETGYPKGTVYQRFACKEDVITALAAESMNRRVAMLERANAFDGRTRERFAAIAEADALFWRLNPDDIRIVLTASTPILEKASWWHVAALHDAERAVGGIIIKLLREAVESGDFPRSEEGKLEELVLGVWGLVEGGFALVRRQVPQSVLGMSDPVTRLWIVANQLLDAYGWEPLFNTWDYHESLARIRKTVFPEESTQAYGEGAWYGDGG